MRTALVLASLLLLQAVGGGAAFHHGSDPGVADRATVPDVPGTAAFSGHEDALVNRVAFLTLESPSRERLVTQPVNATAAVSIGRDEASGRLEAYAFEERLDRTEDPAAVIRAELDAVESDIDALETSERTLRRRYANASIGASTFVRAAAGLQVRALGLRFRLARVRAAIDRGQDDALVARAKGLEHRLIGPAGAGRQPAVGGPVRERVLAALRGTGAPAHVYAAGSGDGVALATIRGSTYVREVYRDDQHSRGSGQFTLTETAGRAAQLYPVAFDLEVSLSTSIVELSRGIPRTWSYRIESRLPIGSIQSYLDAGSRNVFFEIQRRDLGQEVQPASVTARANATRLVVNRSYPGGPLRVAVSHNGTGAPVDATVRVGERRLRTGPDGVVRTLTPPGGFLTVHASRSSGNVTATVAPLELTAVNASS